MKPAIVILFVAVLCTDCSIGSPTPAELEEEIEDNTTGNQDNTLASFVDLRVLIEESRDAIIDHIDEALDEFKHDIILNDDNDFILPGGNINNEFAVDICNPDKGESVCGEFGECILSETDEGYTCSCEYGYTGETCQLIDHCKDISCKNRAECINNRDGYECDCTDGWYGELCDVAVE